MAATSQSYLSPKLEVRSWQNQFGVYALEAITQGELLSVWNGIIVTYDKLADLPADILRHTIQVEDNLYLASVTATEPPDYINHSCNPNAVLEGHLSLIALRDIAADEAISFDYGTSESTPYDEFDCACGSQNCRGRITANDWQNPALWEKYDGYFMPYLQRRINQARKNK